MARRGFRLVEVVNLLTEVTGMLSAAVRKAGGPVVDQNQLFADMQELVKKHGASSPEMALSSVSDLEAPDFSETPDNFDDSEEIVTEELVAEPKYNLAVDLLTAAILSNQTGDRTGALEHFNQACKSQGIEEVLASFDLYNEEAFENSKSDLGIDPSVTDNRQTDSGMDGEDNFRSKGKFRRSKRARFKKSRDKLTMANKISQTGSVKSLKIVHDLLK